MELVLYSAPDCCLCREAVESLAALRRELDFELRVVDISGDPALEARYRERIPVGEVTGRVVFKYRADLERVHRALVEAGEAERAQEGIPRFLVDDMLGRLARWLRALGYDATYARGWPDADLVRCAEKERRTVLTRDTLLLQRRAISRGAVPALLIIHDQLVDQLRQVRTHLGLTAGRPPRCMVCGGVLRPLSEEEAKAHVPPYVAETQPAFRRCGGCGRIVWPGTHWENMRAVLREAGFEPAAW